MTRNFQVIILIVGLLTGFSSNNFEEKQTMESKQSDKFSSKEKIQQARKLLADAKRALGSEGKYKCCLEDPCNQCALDHQSCPCYTDVKAGKPVCPECYAGWQRGEGKDKTIKPGDVKPAYSSHHH